MIDWKSLSHSRFLLTGITGLVGGTVLKLLCEADKAYNLGMEIKALVRKPEIAEERLKSQGILNQVVLIKGDVLDEVKSIEADYIIHCASLTSGKSFVTKPVETIQTSVLGTNNILTMAGEKSVKGIVYVSSMEVYGMQNDDRGLDENAIGTFRTDILRNSYPISKMLCENLCISYSREYHLPVRVARLCQVIGNDIHSGDRRLLFYLKECVEEKKDIELLSSGGSSHNFIYSVDCAMALLVILLNGQSGEIYNVSVDETYCSIKEFANKIGDEYGVGVKIQNRTEEMYPEESHIRLDTTKLCALGWKPVERDILSIFRKIVDLR